MGASRVAVRRIASHQPTLVVLEDLHWADPIAIWVLDHLPRALGDGHIALVATSRDHEPGMARLDGVRRVARVVQLRGLDVDGVRRLVAAETTASVDAVALHARTGGNPLFVQELVRTSDAGGVIGEVLERSLDRFGPDTRALLATAAVGAAVEAACQVASDLVAADQQPRAAGLLWNAREVGQAGQPFAKLGNTGPSSGPHLHFGLLDKPDLFAGRSLPFVFHRFTKVGTIDLDASTGDHLVITPASKPIRRAYPLYLGIVDFPAT